MNPFRYATDLTDPFRQQINRAPSPVIATSIPWLSVILASAAIGWIGIASAPLLPPLGMIALLAWRQIHPGALPIWAALPLGLIDDMFSGQAAGSAIFLWSIMLLLLEIIDFRWPWRNFAIEWALSSALILAYILLCGWFNHGNHAPLWLPASLPQMGLSILLYPWIARVIAALDRLRLVRFRVIG